MSFLRASSSCARCGGVEFESWPGLSDFAGLGDSADCSGLSAGFGAGVFCGWPFGLSPDVAASVGLFEFCCCDC